MNVVIIDGQGGQLGARLVKEILSGFSDTELTAIGTNALATANMLKAGAKNAATGENPAVVACRKADVIIGPIGIVIADSLLGEITPKMALAAAQSQAERILIPMNRCGNLVASIRTANTSELISDTIEKLSVIINKKTRLKEH